MPHFGVRTISSAWLIASLFGATACDKDKIKGPAAEVKKTDIKADLRPCRRSICRPRPPTVDTP